MDTLLLSHLRRWKQKKRLVCIRTEMHQKKYFVQIKSYLGNNCLRVASEESASTKIFIGFIALIIRCKIYQALKNRAKELVEQAELPYCSGGNQGIGKNRNEQTIR